MKRSIYLLSILAFGFSACEKGPGEGGESSIKGKVYVKNYNSAFTTVINEYNSPDQDVYIIYGDDVSFGERTRTAYNGMYEFKYLRPGKYKIYAYSKDSTGAYKNMVDQNAPDKAIVLDVEIKKDGESIEAPLITVLD